MDSLGQSTKPSSSSRVSVRLRCFSISSYLRQSCRRGAFIHYYSAESTFVQWWLYLCDQKNVTHLCCQCCREKPEHYSIHNLIGWKHEETVWPWVDLWNDVYTHSLGALTINEKISICFLSGTSNQRPIAGPFYAILTTPLPCFMNEYQCYSAHHVRLSK